MLNPFPDLLTYSLLAPFLLRVAVGLIFLDLGALAFRKEKARWVTSFSILKIPKPQISVKIFSALEIAGGLALILGYGTQISALVLAIFTFIEAFIEFKDTSIFKRSFVFYFLILVILISLLLTGAGAFAFDLPL